MKTQIVYTLAFVLSLSSACTNSSNDTKGNTDSSKTTLTDTILVEEKNAAKLDNKDFSFFEKAAYGGMIEVETSNKILLTTADSDIKAFADMMVKDHTTVSAELKALAKSKGYTLPSALPDSKLAMIEKFNALKDEGKDEYYIQLMKEEHKKAIDVFSIASTSDDDQIKQFANTVLPKLTHHYQQTLRIDSALKIPKANQGDDPLKLSDRKKQ